jgi:hypothetical protein
MTPPKDRPKAPNIKQLTSGLAAPKPPKPPPPVLTGKLLEKARAVLADYDAIGDYTQRIDAHKKIVEAFTCDVDTLRTRVARQDRAHVADAQRKAIDAVKVEMDAAKATAAAENAAKTERGRRAHGPLGAAEAAATPAAKRGRPRARE